MWRGNEFLVAVVAKVPESQTFQLDTLSGLHAVRGCSFRIIIRRRVPFLCTLSSFNVSSATPLALQERTYQTPRDAASHAVFRYSVFGNCSSRLDTVVLSTSNQIPIIAHRFSPVESSQVPTYGYDVASSCPAARCGDGFSKLVRILTHCICRCCFEQERKKLKRGAVEEASLGQHALSRESSLAGTSGNGDTDAGDAGVESTLTPGRVVVDSDDQLVSGRMSERTTMSHAVRLKARCSCLGRSLMDSSMSFSQSFASVDETLGTEDRRVVLVLSAFLATPTMYHAAATH